MRDRLADFMAHGGRQCIDKADAPKKAPTLKSRGLFINSRIGLVFAQVNQPNQIDERAIRASQPISLLGRERIEGKV